MRRWIPAVLLPVTLSLASASHALAPGDAARGFRDGANHHIGDDSFAALYGRLPGPGDSEPLRMHAHFTHVRRWLAERPPTKPELLARRREILGHFDEYIARGTTPLNVHVPWRSPVFIDDRRTICAVGYLIEQTAGRALAEKVAREHRYSVLEDIAAAMPEVREWVASSGLSLEELASIQPGYIPPSYWNERDLVDGPIDSTPIGLEVEGRSGRWTSRYPTGARLAEGRYVDKRPQGEWRFFHASGNLAAVGSFAGGLRDGAWTFFHDSKHSVPMATGSFVGGVLVDEWSHFDEAGKLVGVSSPAPPSPFGSAGIVLHVMPRGEHGHRWVHQAEIAGMRHRLDYLADGGERLYVENTEPDVAYDPQGHKLARVDAGGQWESSDCHWSPKERAKARSGDIVAMHWLMVERPGVCDAAAPVPAARGRRLEAMLSSLHAASGTTPPAAGDGLPEVLTSSLATLVRKPDVESPASPRLDATSLALR